MVFIHRMNRCCRRGNHFVLFSSHSNTALVSEEVKSLPSELNLGTENHEVKYLTIIFSWSLVFLLQYPIMGDNRKPPWSPAQATGQPDTPDAGIFPTAWSCTVDEQDEWLLLQYEKPITPKKIKIYQVHNPGAINRVSMFKANGEEVVVWSGVDPISIVNKLGISELDLEVPFETSRVKIHIDWQSHSGNHLIDAVGLVDILGNTYWAIEAEASSTSPENGRWVTGQVIDVKDNPIPEVLVSSFWETTGDRLEPVIENKTDRIGKFTVAVAFRNEIGAVIAMDKERERGGILIVRKTDEDTTKAIRLSQLVEVKGTFVNKELDEPLQGVTAYIEIASLHAVVQDRRLQSQFSFRLPPGEYLIGAYGQHIEFFERPLNLLPSTSVLDLGKVNLQTRGNYKPYFGKMAPSWKITEARGLDQQVKLSDLRGKWILLEFWGYWCGPCIGRSLPKLIKIYQGLEKIRDKFEIIAFHDPQAKSFKELDQKLQPIISNKWGGKPLPFPVLLDTTGTTIERFGITMFPTSILIDPEGKVVPGGDESKLVEMLQTIKSD